MFCVPLPAPNRHSARAVALASFSRMTLVPRNAFSKIARTSTPFQPGRFGTSNTTPFCASSGPPQEMPMPLRSAAANFCPFRSLIASSINRWRITFGPSSAIVSISDRAMIFPSDVPSTAAHFVPPISIPRITFESMSIMNSSCRLVELISKLQVKPFCRTRAVIPECLCRESRKSTLSWIPDRGIRE